MHGSVQHGYSDVDDLLVSQQILMLRNGVTPQRQDVTVLGSSAKSS